MEARVGFDGKFRALSRELRGTRTPPPARGGSVLCAPWCQATSGSLSSTLPEPHSSRIHTAGIHGSHGNVSPLLSAAQTLNYGLFWRCPAQLSPASCAFRLLTTRFGRRFLHAHSVFFFSSVLLPTQLSFSTFSPLPVDTFVQLRPTPFSPVFFLHQPPASTLLPVK